MRECQREVLHNGVKWKTVISGGWYGVRLELSERFLFIPLRRCHLSELKQWMLQRFVLTYERNKLVVSAFFECTAYVGQRVNPECSMEFLFLPGLGGFVSPDHFLPVAIAEIFFELPPEESCVSVDAQ